MNANYDVIITGEEYVEKRGEGENQQGCRG
jgi:hypothetical protein